MGGYIILGMLASFGLVCAVWVLAGLLLPRRGGTVVLLEGDPLTAAQRYLWLREMGLTGCRLGILEGENLDREWFLAQGIEIYSREELIHRLKTGEKEFDAGA